MNKKQLDSLKFLVDIMGGNYACDKFIRPLFYPVDYDCFDFTGIGDINNWEPLGVWQLDDEEFLCEIHHPEEAYDKSGNEVIVDILDIECKYAFIWEDGDIGFSVLTMKNGTHYLGEFCAD